MQYRLQLEPLLDIENGQTRSHFIVAVMNQIVCPPPDPTHNSHVEALTPSMMVFGGRLTTILTTTITFRLYDVRRLEP